MSQELPMYQGARMHVSGSGVKPVEVGNVGVSLAGQALEQGQKWRDVVGSHWQALKDGGEDERAKNEMQKVFADMDMDLTGRMGYERGHEMSLLDRYGNPDDGKIDKFLSRYRKQLRAIKGSYVDPTRAEGLRQRKATAEVDLEEKVGRVLLRGQIESTRQAWAEGLEGFVQRQDWAGAKQQAQRGADVGIISGQKANNMAWEFDHRDLLQSAERSMLDDPQQFLWDVSDGMWEGLTPDDKNRFIEVAEKEMGRRRAQLAYTEEELSTIKKGGSVKPRFDYVPGDTAVMAARRRAIDEGRLDLFRDEIGSQMWEDVNNGPTFKSDQEAEKWKKGMIAMYGRGTNGMQLDDDLIAQACDQHINKVLRLNSVELDAVGFVGRLGAKELAPALYEKWREVADKWYWSNSGRAESEGEVVERMNNAVEIIKTRGLNMYAHWRSTSGKGANTNQQVATLASCLQNAAKGVLTGDNNVGAVVLSWAYGQDIEEYYQSNAKNEALLRDQDNKNKRLKSQRIKEREEHEKAIVRDVKVYGRDPVNVSEVNEVPRQDVGVYVDRKSYEGLLRTVGDKPTVMISLGLRGSGNASAVVPVLGWHNGAEDSVTVTRGLRIKRLGVGKPLNRVQLRLMKNGLSKDLKDRDFEKFVNDRELKAEGGEDGVPPDDFGLLPVSDAGVDVDDEGNPSLLPKLKA